MINSLAESDTCHLWIRLCERAPPWHKPRHPAVFRGEHTFGIHLKHIIDSHPNTMISRPYSSSSGSSNRSFGSTIPTSIGGSIESDINNGYSDSSSVPSNSTRNSIRALYYEEHIEHGRRYSGRADQQYYQPADQAQMGSWSVGHLTLMVMDSQQENPWFHSPISEDAKRILDIGTGDGSWVKDVADRFPHIDVLGIDLSPPPAGFVPPNCSFETEDATKEWVWEERFDLIHLR